MKDKRRSKTSVSSQDDDDDDDDDVPVILSQSQNDYFSLALADTLKMVGCCLTAHQCVCDSKSVYLTNVKATWGSEEDAAVKLPPHDDLHYCANADDGDSGIL